MSKVDLNFVRSVKGMPYPNICIEKNEVKKADLDYLANMVNEVKEVEETLISILYKKNDIWVCLGEITKDQVNGLVELFPTGLTGFLDKDNYLEDSEDVRVVLGTRF